MFERQVPVLATSDLTPLHRIQPILDSPCLSSHMQQLERSIKHHSNVSGVRLLDAETTRKYAKKVDYIER
jgi:hypothetical protein